MDASARSIVTPPPSASYSASESAGGARGLGRTQWPLQWSFVHTGSRVDRQSAFFHGYFPCR